MLSSRQTISSASDLRQWHFTIEMVLSSPEQYPCILRRDQTCWYQCLSSLMYLHIVVTTVIITTTFTSRQWHFTIELVLSSPEQYPSCSLGLGAGWWSCRRCPVPGPSCRAPPGWSSCSLRCGGICPGSRGRWGSLESVRWSGDHTGPPLSLIKR